MKPLVIAASFLTACSVQTGWEQYSAVIDVATEPNCDRPGVRLDRIQRLDRKEEVPVLDRFTPVAMKAGRYAVTVACQNPFDASKNACTFWGHPNEYPTYRMPIEAGVRYTFHCFQVGDDLVYRISESHL